GPGPPRRHGAGAAGRRTATRSGCRRAGRSGRSPGTWARLSYRPVELLYGLLEVLLRPPVRRGLRWRVEGVERIPAEGPVLLASNHLSYFDPIAVANLTDLAGRRARFLAKSELFENRVLAAALRRMGQIPVERGTGDAAALEAAAAALG